MAKVFSRSAWVEKPLLQKHKILGRKPFRFSDPKPEDKDEKHILNVPLFKNYKIKFFFSFLKLFHVRDLDDNNILFNEDEYYHFIKAKFTIKHPRKNRMITIIGKIFKLSRIFLFCLLFVSYNN